MEITNQSTLLDVLEAGCEVRFPSGYYLKGDPVNKYVDVGFYIENQMLSEGLWHLSKEQLTHALNDERIYRESLKQIDP